MGEFPVRVQYRTGQHLTSGLLTTEQDFHRTMQERHHLSAHEWGIAQGLELTGEAVAPGVAYDGFGRTLVLATRTQFDVRAAYALYDVDDIDVSLVYSFVPDPDADVIVERPVVVLTRSVSGVDRRLAPAAVPSALGFDSAGQAPRDLTHPWPVYLGTLVRDPAAPLGPLQVKTADRPYVGVRAARMRHPAGGFELDLDTGVTITSANGASEPVLAWDGADNTIVSIGGPLTVAGDVAATAVELGRSDPSTAGWSLQRVHGDSGTEEMRLILGADPAPSGSSSARSSFVVGAVVDGTFKALLTVESDGTVTVDGNLIVTKDLTVNGQVRP